MVTGHGAGWFLGSVPAAILYLCWACLDVCYEDGNIILVEDVDKGVRGCVNMERDPEMKAKVRSKGCGQGFAANLSVKRSK